MAISQDDLDRRMKCGAKSRQLKPAPVQKPQQVEVSLKSETQVVEVEVKLETEPQQVEVKVVGELNLNMLAAQVASLTRLVQTLIENGNKQEDEFLEIVRDQRTDKMIGIRPRH